MKELTLALVIALSNQGHWFGGQPGMVEVSWATSAAAPEALLSWELELASARLASGQVTLEADQPVTRIGVAVPPVRVRTAMCWTYRVTRPGIADVLTGGSETIHVYPEDLLAGVGKRLEGKTLVVCDRAEGLPRMLAAAGILHTCIDDDAADVGKLGTVCADVILVGPDWLTGSPFSQTALLNQAQSGRSVLVFAQSRVRRLAGYALLRRARPSRLEWRMDHALLEGFRAGGVQDWLRWPGDDVWAIQLPADEPALEVVYWPRETPGRDPVPIDALLVVRHIGEGRIVLCQLPMARWSDDPRAQLFVRNALNYLVTRPETTPSPSQRAIAQPPRPQRESEIAIPSGARL